MCTYHLKIPTGDYKMTFATLAGVLEPTVFARLLLCHLVLRENEKNGFVLDAGTGSGVLAISLALSGCKHVHAVDITTESIEACKQNAEASGVIDRIMSRKSDIIDFVANINSKYDLVIANPPTFAKDKHVMKGTSLDSSFFCNDDGHYFVDALAKRAPDILKPAGRLILAYPSYLDKNRIESILGKGGLDVTTIGSQNVNLKIYSKIFEKYGYDPKRILNHLMTNCQKSAKKGFLWKSGKDHSFVLYIIEASKKYL